LLPRRVLRTIRRVVTDGSSPQTTAFCSRLSAERGLPPIGSAGCYDAIVAFELGSPWTPKLAGSSASDDRLDAAITAVGKRAKRVRLLALEPAEDLRRARGAGRVRVLHFFRTGEQFSGYARRDYDVPRAALAAALEALAGIGEREDATGPHEVEAGVRDILVCTHGARDACCGKFGYGFYVAMRGLAALRAGGTRVWRTSHLGGHRFAPTLLDLPSGRIFGRLDASDAEVVLEGGERLLARLPAIYRGRCALPEPAQIVERELWLRTGASFESRAVTVRAAEEQGTWSIRLDSDDGSSLAARVARVEVDAIVTPASCGRDPEPEAPWRIVE
jgi:hypothetical protein